MPVSYTHLDVYKRQAFAAAKEKLINQLKDAGAQDSVDWWQSAWETTLKGLENIE